MAVWSDVGVLDGAFVCMVGDSSGTVQFRRWNGGSPQLISQVSFGRTAAQYRMCVAGGRCYAVAHVGDRIDECMVIRDDGKMWNSGMSAVGTNCVGLRDAGGKLEVAWVRTGVDKLCRVFLSYDLVPLEDTFRQPTISIGPTTEGFLLFNSAEEPVWTKTNVPSRFGGVAKGYLWHSSHENEAWWTAFQEDGNPERISVYDWSEDHLYLVAEAHTESPPRVAVIGDDVLVAIGGHDWFVPRSQFTPWTPPNAAPVPVPVPSPTPEPVPMPNTISGSEITSIVEQAKRDVEAAGVTFKTPEQATANFTYEDKQKAFLVTMRAAWELARRYPNAGIGLEAYDGVSGTPSPFPEDGTQKYSFDIILLGRSGPSADVMGAGVIPTAQIVENAPATTVEAWQRDWRPVVNPNRGTPRPTPQPQPEPVPQPTPTPQPDAVLAFLRDLDAKVDALAAVVGATADAVTVVRDGLNVMDLNVETLLMDVDQLRNQAYETRIFGSSVTLRPKR